MSFPVVLGDSDGCSLDSLNTRCISWYCMVSRCVLMVMFNDHVLQPANGLN
jgi:hypothetical protein